MTCFDPHILKLRLYLYITHIYTIFFYHVVYCKISVKHPLFKLLRSTSKLHGDKKDNACTYHSQFHRTCPDNQSPRHTGSWQGCIGHPADTGTHTPYTGHQGEPLLRQHNTHINVWFSKTKHANRSGHLFVLVTFS